jgi:hypothetical protein
MSARTLKLTSAAIPVARTTGINSGPMYAAIALIALTMLLIAWRGSASLLALLLANAELAGASSRISVSPMRVR